MIKFANAKINLGLQVLRRRPDGYHDLSTIFIPVGKRSGLPGIPGTLCDILELTPAAEDSLTVTGADFDTPPEHNLVWRALAAFRGEVPELPPVGITLEKHLPSGAGMGGGSADAAFTLEALNELCGTPLSLAALSRIAVGLGADVPFFLINKPCYATGVGEMLAPLEIPQLEGKWVAVLKPSEGISTAQAFGLITPRESGVSLTEAVNQPIEDWKALITNDFEEAMYSVHPSLRSLKSRLYDCGALYASMTGSGSAFFGIFASPEEARVCVERAHVPFATFTAL